MNKKGALLLHWVAFGILAALGFFFLLTYNSDVGITIKGDWQLDFLRGDYIEGEKELLRNDQLALLVGKETVFLLTKKGGFSNDAACYFYYNYEGKKSCFETIEIMVNTSFNQLMKKQKGGSYNITFEGEELIGKTEETVDIRSGEYSLKKHFRVNVGYDFSEFARLQSK